MFRSSLLNFLVPSRRTLSPPQTRRRRIFFEPLEERRVLATVSDGGTTTLSIALAADEDPTIVSQGSSYLFGSDLTFTAGSVADSADFSGFGTSSLTLNGSGLTRYSTISITDAGANATVTFNDSGANAYSDHFTITLNNLGSGSIAFNGTSDFNSSTVTLSSPGAIVAGTANIAAATLDIRAGTFTQGMNDQIGNGTNLIVSGGTFALGTFNETVGGVTLTSGSITGTTGILTSTTTFDMRKGTVSANLAGAVGLNKSTADIVTLTGTNNYSGATTITGGMIEADDSNALGNASATNDLVFNGAGTHLRALGTIASPATRDVVFTTAATFDSGSNVISLGGVITGTPGALALVKNGVGGTLVLGNSSNSFSGAMSVNAGILSVGSDGALGNANNDISLTSGGGTFQVTGDTLFGTGRTISLGTNATHTFDVAAGAKLTVNVGLIGFPTSAIRKIGLGTLALNAAAGSSLGSTTIDAGTLLANNLAASALGPAGTTITINSTGVLGGTGGVAGLVIVNSGGAIAPGTSAGKLKTGGVSLPSGTNFNIELNGVTAGTGHDQLDVTGSVTLNDANLNLTLGYVPVNGQTFTILNNDGVDGILGSGTFKVGGVTIPDGGSFAIGANTFFIDYTAGLDNNDVVLTVQTNVPPTADAGGPYSVSEGSSIQLNATNSSDPDQAANSLTYEWDYDYDGVTFQVDAQGSSTPTFSAASLDDPLTRTLAVRVTDNAGASNIDTATLTVNNVAPSLVGVAITSPLLENGTAHLTGTISDPGTLDTFTLVVNWGEGAPVNYNFPAGTTAFDVAHQYKDDNPTATASDVYDVAYSLTDDNAGAATPAATTVTVSNVAPVAALAGPTVGVRSQSMAFTGSFTDVGSLDSHEVQWNFGDGVEIPFQPSTNLNALTPAHSYATSGTYTVSFTVKDDDGGQHTVSTTITIVAVMLETAPCGCGTAVVVGGTEAADTIAVNKVAAGVEIVVNGVSLGTWDPSQAIVAYGYGGGDEIQIQPTITNLGVWLYGGQGDDRLKGGGGHDVVMGGEGDDLIVGSWGRDILIGGTGVDRIVGNGDDDILISGTTDYDSNTAALFAILAEWASDRDANSRVNNISNIGSGPRLNENYFLTAATVHDDGVRDLLTGSTGFDWFFANLSLSGNDDSLIKDKITDLSAAEFAQDIDFIGL